MGAIDSLLSSPISSSLAVAVAVMLIAVFWYFVIPMQEELKRLRTLVTEQANTIIEKDKVIQAKDKQLEDKDKIIHEKDQQLSELRVKHADDIEKMSQTLGEILEAVERPVSVPTLEDMRALLAPLATAISGNRHLDPEFVHNVNALLTSIDKNTERLLRQSAEISDKQSQVSGMILGFSMPRGGSPRGV